MAKPKPIFVCSNCDSQFPKWQGRCPQCGQWGTVTEGVAKPVDRRRVDAPPGTTVSFDEVSGTGVERRSTGLREVDRVLGGGLVPGSLILLGGDPGIGKSTLVLQVAAGIAASGSVLYVSGEESADQVKLRLGRLTEHAGTIRYLGETNVETIVATIEHEHPLLAIVDSIQTVYWPGVPSEAGSVNQVRAATVKFLEAAKRSGTAIVIVGHVTKEGYVAGPKTLEHLVDTVLYLEGDQYHAFRILRAAKNRFGSTNEVGVFDMRSRGLVEVENPSALFLSERQPSPGSCVAAVIEGSRPFLIEVQALVNPTVFGMPRRTGSGIEFNRLQLLLAVLSKRAGLKLGTYDVFVNIVGGFRVDEPAVDLAVCLAVASAALGKRVDPGLVAIGEVGLGGEIRSVPRLELRLSEASKLGFKNAAVAASAKFDRPRTVAVVGYQTVADAVKELL